MFPFDFLVIPRELRMLPQCKHQSLRRNQLVLPARPVQPTWPAGWPAALGNQAGVQLDEDDRPSLTRCFGGWQHGRPVGPTRPAPHGQASIFVLFCDA